MRSEEGVQRRFPLWQGAWGLCPQFPKKGRAGGDQDICLIGTMLVEKTSASLNTYITVQSLTHAERPCYYSPHAQTTTFPAQCCGLPRGGTRPCEGPSLSLERPAVREAHSLRGRLERRVSFCLVRVSFCHSGLSFCLARVTPLSREPKLKETKCYRMRHIPAKNDDHDDYQGLTPPGAPPTLSRTAETHPRHRRTGRQPTTPPLD